MCKFKNLFIAISTLLLFSNTALAEDINQTLITKVSFGKAADVQLLLDQNANPNAQNVAGSSASLLAANRSDIEGAKILAALIKAGADIYTPNQNGNLPIIEAVKRGTAQSVKVLIDNKTIMSVKDKWGNDLLSLATKRGDAQILALVKSGLTAEQKNLETLKSTDSLTKQVQKYSMLSCAAYYLSYYKQSNPEKMADDKYNALIKKNQEDVAMLDQQMRSLFDLRNSDFNYIKAQTKKQIGDKLDSLVNNENRLYNGFGTNEHLNKTCQQIAKTWDGKRLPANSGAHSGTNSGTK